MFPSEWNKQMGQRKKRRAPDDAPTAAQAQQSQVVEQDEAPPSLPLEDLRLPSIILRNINTTSRAPATPVELDLDVILSRVPYREILENLYGRDEYPVPDVPVISKAYEEAFLREPMAGERACASGELCECNFIDPCVPFTAVEFLMPREIAGKKPQFCVLCSRKVTQKMFYDILYTGKEVHGVIQRYGNICNVPGECDFRVKSRYFTAIFKCSENES